MVLVYSESCNHHHNQFQDVFITPTRNLTCPQLSPPNIPISSPRQLLIYFVSQQIYLFWTFHLHKQNHTLWSFVTGVFHLSEKSESVSNSLMSNSLQPYELEPARLLYPWNSPGKNTRVGSHSLLQGISPAQRLNPGLLHCRQILYHLSHQGRLLSLNPTSINQVLTHLTQCFLGFIHVLACIGTSLLLQPNNIPS